MGCLHSFRRKKKFFLEDLCPMLTLFFLTMLCNFVVEISVGGLAWCLKQTQKNFFFKKNKGQECVCYQKNFGCLSIFTTRATAFFSKTMVYLSERKHPKLNDNFFLFFEKIFFPFFSIFFFYGHFFCFSDTFFWDIFLKKK